MDIKLKILVYFKALSPCTYLMGDKAVLLSKFFSEHGVKVKQIENH